MAVINVGKVMQFTLQIAASVAELLMTTEAMAGEKPEKKKASATSQLPMDDMF